MTKNIYVVIGVLTLCITFIMTDKIYTDKKIESFCEERDISEETCLCVTDFFLHHTPREIRKEFVDAVKNDQDLMGHPSLIIPLVAAGIKCKDVLEK